MNSILRIVITVSLFIYASFSAAQESSRDSVMQEVIVFGKKIEQFSAGSRITSIDTNYLATYNSSKLSDILQARTPLYIKSYGNGMLSSISIRGTSSQHTALLWNGFNINWPSLGQADFGIIPINCINAVDIQHGSSSSNYGSGAIGGSILLSSQPTWKKKMNLGVQQDFGSFGSYFTTAAMTWGNEKLQTATQFYINTSDNNFKYTPQTGQPKERQVNAAIAQNGITQDLHYRFSHRTQISLKGWYNYSDRQIQPSMGSNNNGAWEIDKNLRIMSELNHQSNLGNSTFRLGYFDDLINYSNDKSRIKTYQSQIEHTVTLYSKFMLKAGADIQYFDTDVKAYGRNVNELRNSIFGLIRYNPIRILDISLNVRQAFVQNFNPPLAPSLGANLKMVESKKITSVLKGNISKSYRVPTLNERFWPTGNPNLKPETGLSYEGGIFNKVSIENFSWETELTYFHMLVDNWVLWLPVRLPSGIFDYSPINIEKVKSRGLEATSKINYKKKKFKGLLGYAYSYVVSTKEKAIDITDLGKQLIYVPLNTYSVYSDLSYGNWFSNLTLNYVGYRYTNSDNSNFISDYSLMNCALGRTFTFKKYRFQFIAKVNNLFNSVYQNYEARATPLRNYSLSLRLNFTK